MIDFTGKKLEVGDYVSASLTGKGIGIAIITKITPKGATMEGYRKGWRKTYIEFKCNRSSDYIMKLSPEDGKQLVDDLKKLIIKQELRR